MADMYGERLSYMRTMYVEGNPDVTESAGVWVNIPADSDHPNPEYRVIAVRPWGAHTVVDLEKVRA
jgi:hypothetical protein